MTSQITITFLLCLSAGACVPPPPAPPQPAPVTTVAASFGKTWDATIDQFALKNIPIKTIDRSSGLIATDALSVPSNFADYADCGSDSFGSTAGRSPTTAAYNVVVRGDSTSTTVRVTVHWVRVGTPAGLLATGVETTDCSTKGVWEGQLQNAIKMAAEHKGTTSR